MASWVLDPDITHINHGSFGATPVRVLEDQNDWRRRMEFNPVRFFDEEYPLALTDARDRLVNFVGGSAHSTVFVNNSTTGVNAVLNSISLEEGDEIVVTTHAYNACRNAAEAYAERSGASVVVVPIPFPPPTGIVMERLGMAVGPKTRLIIVDHITSPTAFRMPVEEVVATYEPDIPVLVDGAHAPGMIELDVDEVGASFYVGNLHKWVCAPKGAGFLSVSDRFVERMVPPVISHGWSQSGSGGNRFHALFDWTGTDDPSAWLAVPAAIDTMANAHPDGWAGVMEANRTMALEARRIVAELLDLDPGPDAELIGSMAALVLPGVPDSDGIYDDLTPRLRHNHGIEVAVFAWEGRRVLRMSAQRYNRLDDYRRLVDSLLGEIG